jgi:hypothetical protein
MDLDPSRPERREGIHFSGLHIPWPRQVFFLGNDLLPAFSPQLSLNPFLPNSTSLTFLQQGAGI